MLRLLLLVTYTVYYALAENMTCSRTEPNRYPVGARRPPLSCSRGSSNSLTHSSRANLPCSRRCLNRPAFSTPAASLRSIRTASSFRPAPRRAFWPRLTSRRSPNRRRSSVRPRLPQVPPSLFATAHCHRLLSLPPAPPLSTTGSTSIRCPSEKRASHVQPARALRISCAPTQIRRTY